MGVWLVDADVLASSRFAVSPLIETINVLGLLATRDAQPWERTWLTRHRETFRARVAADPFSSALITTALAGSWLPVAIGSPPKPADVSFDLELARLRTTPAGVARADLAQAIGGGPLPPALTIADPAGAVADLLQWNCLWRLASSTSVNTLQDIVKCSSVKYTSTMHASPVGTPKPPRLFDRDAEWTGLVSFAADARPGATLGVVSGRRRQGKSYLLQGLATALGGIYFPALELTEAVSLRLFADELIRFSGSPVRPFRDWLDAIPYLFRLAGDRVVPVVIDEFPFLVKASPGLPSIIQRELGPGGSGSTSRTRLLLCGSAMSVMGGLLSGSAPLRGRAGFELIVHPFGYRDAARFWDITDPKLAALVHSVVGGTPAYRRELLREDSPANLADFDPWVIRTVLNPQTPLFREARYLLAEETEIRDPSLYHSVLAAVAEGNNTSGGIASYIGRKSNEVAHPLRVLEDSRLLIKEPDLFRSGRARYRIAEPLITFYQAIMSREWARLELGGGSAVWSGARARFLSQVTGPHFEAICRDYAIAADPAVFGGPPGEVGSGVVSDPANRTQIQIDVAVLAPAEHGRPRKILSLGEVKWDRVMDLRHVERLRRAQDLLAVKGFDTQHAVLACYSGAGFDRELQAGQRPDIRLVGLDQLYAY